MQASAWCECDNALKMNVEKINIFLVEDDPSDCRLVKLALAKSRQPVEFTVQTAGSLAECLECLKNNSFDLMLLDLGLPDSHGLATVDKVCEACPNIPVVVLTGLADEEVGVEAIKRGASDYLVKSKFFRDLLVRTIRYSLEREQAKEALEGLNGKLSLANRELCDFTYIAAHDLKSPLHGIKILAEWVSTDYGNKLDEKGREQMDLLMRQVDRIYGLIDGILEYSKVSQGKEEQVQVNLNELVPEVIDMVVPPENIAITVESELPVVECGKTQIIQIFENLLGNAVKYMDKPQGQIRIGCVAEDGFWKFSVKDNGPGIAEEHFERIFKIFQKLSPPDEVESTGIGLAVVKKIVELYGGNVWVESKPGQGSTFFFTLPKQKMGITDAKLKANIIG